MDTNIKPIPQHWQRAMAAIKSDMSESQIAEVRARFRRALGLPDDPGTPAAPVPARLSDHDLIEIARTIAAMATARERMTLEELQTAPCPLDPESPLVRAARAACVERGYGIDGEKGGA